MISTKWWRGWRKLSGRRAKRPQHLVVDEGYTTRENILVAAERGVDLIGSSLEPDPEATTRRLQQRGVDAAFYPRPVSLRCGPQHLYLSAGQAPSLSDHQT